MTTQPLSRIAEVGCLRREYFCQEEDQGPLRHPARPSHGTQAGRRSFSLGGHRLSSLYRAPYQSALTLILRKGGPVSSWQKYSISTKPTGATTGAGK